jgi:hypothetical protein
LLIHYGLSNLHKLRCFGLVLFEPDLAVVRIEEHSQNIRRIEVGDGVVLLQLQLTNVKAGHKE